MKNLYDLSFWINIKAGPDEQEKIFKILEKYNCEIVQELKTLPKRKNLAYPIGSETTGYFGTIYFKTQDTSVIPKIESELKRMENILRFLIVKRKTLPQIFKKVEVEQSNNLLEKV